MADENDVLVDEKELDDEKLKKDGEEDIPSLDELADAEEEIAKDESFDDVDDL